MGDYYDPYGGYEDDSTSSTEPPSSSSRTATTLTTTTEQIPPAIAEVTPWGGPFGSVTPEKTATPEATILISSEAAAHPFGESGPSSEGEVPSFPENPAAAHPFGEGASSEIASWPERPGPEGEPEGAPEGAPENLIRTWNVAQCTGYSNPFAPQPEPEGEPVTGEPYAEPPAPLLQSVNFEERGVYSTLAAVVAGLIIFLNILVLVALFKKPKQRKSLTYLLGLIAGFDILGGLQFLWFSSFDLHLMYTHANMWILVMCGIWMLSLAPQIGALIHFGLHLINEIDLGVGNAKLSIGRIIFIVVTVFHVPLALFIPPLAGWNCIGCINPLNENYCERKCSIPIFPFTKNYVLLMTILLLLAIVAAVCVYGYLHMKASKNSLTSKSGNCDAIQLTECLLTTYIVCTLPVAIVMIADFATIYCNPQLINAFHATLFVTFLSNLVNPLVVFAKMPSMRSVLAGQRVNEYHKTNGNGVNGAFALEEKSDFEDEKKMADEEAASKI